MQKLRTVSGTRVLLESVCFALFCFVSRRFGNCLHKSSGSLPELYWSTCTPGGDVTGINDRFIDYYVLVY